MRFPLPAAIAWRYLRSKKQNGAVSKITTVSVVATAVATAAIVCVLSVFNGFEEVIADRLDTLSPDLLVTPRQGKAFAGADALTERIRSVDGVAFATATLADNALVIANSQELPVKIKGIDPEEYARVTSVRSVIPADYGSYFHAEAEGPEGVASVGVASRLGLYGGQPMLVFAPRREGRVNMANPAASFVVDSLTVCGIYRCDQQEFDSDGLLAPIGMVRSLLDREGEASAVEVAVTHGQDIDAVAAGIRRVAGEAFEVRNRLEQQSEHFRMVRVEKWISFLLLAFILVIASFNIMSSLSMLVLEKRDHLATLHSLGMTRRQVGRVFAWESLYVCVAGGLAGIVLGVALCVLQRSTGLIKLGGDPTAAIIRAYPVRLEAVDLLWTLLPVLAIAAFTALLTAGFARNGVKGYRVKVNGRG